MWHQTFRRLSIEARALQIPRTSSWPESNDGFLDWWGPVSHLFIKRGLLFDSGGSVAIDQFATSQRTNVSHVGIAGAEKPTSALTDPIDTVVPVAVAHLS